MDKIGKGYRVISRGYGVSSYIILSTIGKAENLRKKWRNTDSCQSAAKRSEVYFD